MTYKHMGNGWIYGVPARDLTDEEFAALSDELKEAAAKLYKYIQPRQAANKPQPAQPAETAKES